MPRSIQAADRAGAELSSRLAAFSYGSFTYYTVYGANLVVPNYLCEVHLHFSTSLTDYLV